MQRKAAYLGTHARPIEAEGLDIDAAAGSGFNGLYHEAAHSFEKPGTADQKYGGDAQNDGKRHEP